MLPNNVYLESVFCVDNVVDCGSLGRYSLIKDSQNLFYVFDARIDRADFENCKSLARILAKYCAVLVDSRLTPEQLGKIYGQN